MYHRIGNTAFDPWGLAVEEAQFDAQLRWLARNRDVMPLGEFARRHRERRLGRDALSITFDDGYSSVLEGAVPILERHGLTATLFLPAECIERGREFWWDELARIIIGFPSDRLKLGRSTLPVPAPTEHDGTWAPDAPPSTPRQALFHSIWQRFRLKRPQDLDKAMAGLRSQADGIGAPSDAPLTPAELKAMRSPVIEFGSHALTHSSLPRLGAKERAREIAQSRERCKALTGKMPRTFAYPYGDHGPSDARLVEDAGYVCAVTTDPAFVKAGIDCYSLPRMAVGNWPASKLRNRLRGR